MREDELGGVTSRIEAFQCRARNARAIQIDEIEARPAVLIGENESERRDIPVGNRHFRAGDLCVPDIGLQRMRRNNAGAFGRGKTADHLARGDLRQDFGFLLLAAEEHDGFGEEPDRRRKGDRRRYAPELLGDDAELQMTEPEAAETLRDRRSQPTLFDDRPPELRIIGLAVVVQNFAHAGARAIGLEKFAHLDPEEFLVVRKIKIHPSPPAFPGLLPNDR